MNVRYGFLKEICFKYPVRFLEFNKKLKNKLKIKKKLFISHTVKI